MDAQSTEETGCAHYKRKCAFISPCCGKQYTCRLCHNDSENHEINRYKVQEIICLKCETKQEVQKTCKNCSVVFGNYFCGTCRLFDDVDKKQFHCDPCGLCRVGGRENFFHCPRCDMCLGISMKEDHKCIEKVSHSNCPVCMDDLHSSVLPLAVPPCGHLIHRSCYSGMLKTGNYACPICNRSMVDMDSVWKHLDEEIEQTPMPEEYRDKLMSILCRDCHKNSRTKFHVLGLKCRHCGSYNTAGDDEREEEQGVEEGEEALIDREQPDGEETAQSPAQGQIGDGQEAGGDGRNVREQPSGGSHDLPPRDGPDGIDEHAS